MRHNQASHAGLSLQYRQDLCSISRCFSPKALHITFHSFPDYFPVHSLDFRTPVLWKPLAVEKASALRQAGKGAGRGTIKKLNSRKTGLQVWRRPGFVSQRQITRAATRRQLASALPAPQNFSRSPAHLARRERGKRKSQAGKAEPSVWSASKCDALCKQMRGPGNLPLDWKQEKHQL